MRVVCMDCNVQIGYAEGVGVSHGLCFVHYVERMDKLGKHCNGIAVEEWLKWVEMVRLDESRRT